MKTIEFDKRLPLWLNNLLNRAPFAIDADRCTTLFARCSDVEGLYDPGDISEYMNGVWFVRLRRPFGIFLGARPVIDGRMYQLGLGWKGNGRFAITARRQTFEQAAAGVQGPNSGHARGWSRGNA